MKHFGKIAILVVVLVLASNSPAHALVIVAPLIAISAFKAAVFLVSVLSLPVMALIHVVKKWRIIKTIVLSLIILATVFGAVFATLSLYKEKSLQKIPTQINKYDKSMPVVGFMAPQEAVEPFPNEYIPSEDQPRTPYTQLRQYPDPTFSMLAAYLVVVAVVFVCLLVPIFIILVAINKARNEGVSLKKMIGVSVLVGVVIAIPLAFCLGLLYLVASGNVMIY